MMTVDSLTASATLVTFKPSASALARDGEPSFNPTRTSTPLSRKLSACACPWEP